MRAVSLMPLLAVALLSNAAVEAQAPKLSRPKPAPPISSAMPALPRAVIDETLAIGGEDLKARKVETRLSVEVRVNGSGPYQFLVDSGADTSVVGLGIARDLKLPLGTPALLNGMTDRNIVDRVKIDSMTLGSYVTRYLQVPALREEDLGARGLIGIDALVRRRLMMDFDKRLIKVENADKPPKRMPGEIVVTAKRRRGQLILTQVKAGRLSLDAVIDTGAEITIGNLLLRDQLIRRRQKFEMVQAIGVTGKAVSLQVAWIPELEIGKLTVRDVPVAFADLPPFQVFGLSTEPALLLGTDVLERFSRVSLDFNARKVRFQLRRCQPNPLATTVPLSGSRTC
jgi:hypothetical protein